MNHSHLDEPSAPYLLIIDKWLYNCVVCAVTTCDNGYGGGHWRQADDDGGALIICPFHSLGIVIKVGVVVET